jgi:hypothetical protein
VLRAAEELRRDAARALGEPARDEHDEDATMRALVAAWPDRSLVVASPARAAA